MILEGGENIKYNSTTTIRMRPVPWHNNSEEALARVQPRRKINYVTDEMTIKYLDRQYNLCLERNHPKEAAKFFSLTIKLKAFMIIKDHCI